MVTETVVLTYSVQFRNERVLRTNNGRLENCVQIIVHRLENCVQIIRSTPLKALRISPTRADLTRNASRTTQ
jgi:hypothetical protein